MSVFVLDKHKKPLMPCSNKRARLILAVGRARVHKLHPFTIRLTDRLVENSILQPVTVKIDPGATTTGIALVRVVDTNEDPAHHVLHLSELTHRGKAIKKALQQRAGYRRRRRSKNLRYRPARFDNRSKPKGWLAPSLRHRVETVTSWIARYRRSAPVSAIAMELVRFDMQLMQNPDVEGVGYQNGTLAGTEVREYLLEKWGRKCAYCSVKNAPLNIDHVIPRASGGTDRVSNLTLACIPCNERKGKQSIEQFLARDPKRLALIKAGLKRPLNSAAAVNATRWALWRTLVATGLPVECATGGRTKWNRGRFDVPKTHALDAACVGKIGNVWEWRKETQDIRCTGRGSYQRTNVDASGFPRGKPMPTTKKIHGFKTGDLVTATLSKGVHIGTWIGRVAVRATGSFNIQTKNGTRQGISWRNCQLLQSADGYGYQARPALSLPALNDRVSCGDVG